MRPYILTGALWLAACSPNVPTARLDDAPALPPPASEAAPQQETAPSEQGGPSRGCDTPPDASELAGLDDRLTMLTASIHLARDRDAECGPPPAAERQCRALFLLGATDPVLVWANGAVPGEIGRSGEVWRYAAAEGLASSSPEMTDAWRILVRFAELVPDALVAGDEAAVAALLGERGGAADDLATLETFCGL